MKTILLLSGGLDSTTLLWYLRSLGHDVAAVAFDYEQQHRERELAAARTVCPDVTVLSFPRLRRHDPIIPDGHYADESMKATVYPNRNMVMISIAVGIAVDCKADAVAYAAHGGDHTIYPDCRPEFFDHLRLAIKQGNWHQVELIAPFIYRDKSDIVRSGFRLGVPFGMTWSCYKGGEYHCGTCGTCVERREAFQLAGVNDPTFYVA